MGKEITIFGKRRTSADGKKQFMSYLTTLTKKDGTEETVSVKFREKAGYPEVVPCNIIIEKDDANISKRKYKREDTGEIAEAKSLWITKWKKGSEYVDHSLDDYDI